MATQVFTIKRGDRLPYIATTLLDGEDVADLGEATEVTFVMRRAGETEPCIRKPAEIADAEAGQVRYEWADGDTATAGRYAGEFEVSYGGIPVTYPSVSYIVINIIADLG